MPNTHKFLHEIVKANEGPESNFYTDPWQFSEPPAPFTPHRLYEQLLDEMSEAFRHANL